MMAVKDSTERQAAASLAHQITSGRPSKPARRELARQNGSASCFFLVSNRTPNSVRIEGFQRSGRFRHHLGRRYFLRNPVTRLFCSPLYWAPYVTDLRVIMLDCDTHLKSPGNIVLAGEHRAKASSCFWAVDVTPDYRKP